MAIDKLEAYLEGYDRDKKEYIIRGFREGFSIGCKRDVSCKEPKNLKSAYQYPHVVDEKIRTELAAGRMLGPYDAPPVDNLVISPIGLQPKKSGDFRMITHLSHPKGCSVNDAIPDDFATINTLP